MGSGTQDKDESIRENRQLILEFLANSLPLLRRPRKDPRPHPPFYQRFDGLNIGDRDPATVEEEEVAAMLDGDVDVDVDGEDDEDEDEDEDDEEGEDNDDREGEGESGGAAAAAGPRRKPADRGLTDAQLARLTGPAPVTDFDAESFHKNLELKAFGGYRPTARSQLEQVDRGGEVHLTVKLGEPYDSWRIPMVAKDLNDGQARAQERRETAAGAAPGSMAVRFPRFDLLAGLPFVPERLNGYEHRRTIGFKHELSHHDNVEIAKGARTYIFVRSDGESTIRGAAGKGGKEDNDEEDDKKGRGKVNNKPKRRHAKSGRGGPKRRR